MGNGYARLANEEENNDVVKDSDEEKGQIVKRRRITYRTNSRPDFMVVATHERTYFRPENDKLQSSCWQFVEQVIQTFQQIDRCDFPGEIPKGDMFFLRIPLDPDEKSKTQVYNKLNAALSDLVIFKFAHVGLNSVSNIVVGLNITGWDRSVHGIPPRKIF